MKKTKKTKRIIIFSIILVLIIAVVTTIIIINKKQGNPLGSDEDNQELPLYDTNISDYIKETENGIKVNTNIPLNQDKAIGKLTATGIQLTSQSGIATLIATVTNNTGAKTNLQNIEIIFLDKDSKQIGKAKGVVDALEPGASTRLNVSMSGNYVKAYNIEFRVK